MVFVVAAALLVIAYYRLISRCLIFFLRCRRRLRRRRQPNSSPSSTGGDYSDSPERFHIYSYGLDESVIKNIPISLFNKLSSQLPSPANRECAVCLLEFEFDDYVRLLPACSHVFHVDCIDIWLKSHANCPLCRAGIFIPPLPESPPLFVPLMAERIRPSLDSIFHYHSIDSTDLWFEPPAETIREFSPPEITEEEEEIRDFNLEIRNNNLVLLNRSYSFEFDRSETMLSTASPLGSYSANSKPSFRIKSPFFRRRSEGFFPLSERVRSKSMTSPRFFRPSTAAAAAFLSSRVRCGDPEALISPERLRSRILKSECHDWTEYVDFAG
ncbi:RING-H2 finger protein ATL65 [Linum perenne]